MDFKFTPDLFKPDPFKLGRQEWQFAQHAGNAATPILGQGAFLLVPDEAERFGGLFG
jgi:hypothetical protein